MNELVTIALTGFGSVFLLGFQSRNVNHGDYGWAAITSIGVGLSQTFLWKHIIQGEGMAAGIVYALSGAAAITTSMYVHERFIQKKPKPL